MVYSNRLRWETMRSISAAALTGGFDAVGTPLSNPSFILKMVNASDTLVQVSIDGSTYVDVLPANSFFLYDEKDDLPANTQIYVTGTAGTGTIYLVSQYRAV